MALIAFDVSIEKFGKMGEKTGWTYFVIPLDIAEKINPGVKKSYRVQGLLDQTKINGIAILPMGEGNFIMSLKQDIRKQIKKGPGDRLHVQLMVDKEVYQLNTDMMECLEEDVMASRHFHALPKSHQNYYSKYIDAAKTDNTKAKRIAMVVHAMHLNMTYAEMLRHARER
jgi:hypothetical protein